MSSRVSTYLKTKLNDVGTAGNSGQRSSLEWPEATQRIPPQGLVGPVTLETHDLFDDYDCWPDTAADKIDPTLAAQIAQDRQRLGLPETKNRPTRA